MKRPKARARDGDTEQRILDAAHAVFVARGTAGARMQDIAAEARVNQALLHYYFRSKDRLAEAVFHRAAGQLFPQVIEVLASDLSIETKVERTVTLELDRLLRTPYLPGYILSELHHHPQRVVQLLGTVTGMPPEVLRRRVLAKLHAQLGAAARAGTMRPIAAEQFLVNLLSLCIFPFAARPMLMALLGLNEAGFARFIGKRRTHLAAFVLGALRS